MVEDMVARGQKVFRRLKHAPFPVVAAPSGMALGGGCEVCLNADAIQAHAETYIGLVEVGVGVIPAWTGSTELLTRWVQNPKRPRGPMPPLVQTFETIGMAKVAKSAFEARELLFLREGDGITMNRDRLLADAKAQALAMVEGYVAPEKSAIALPGPSGRLALEMAVDALRLKGAATPHDEVVAGQLAGVLSGGATDITTPVGDDELLKLEREAFMTLIKQPATLARIEHMLETGKPLRN
jgi:3-hydroxyacyl-CoA dehydrogenase